MSDPTPVLPTEPEGGAPSLSTLGGMIGIAGCLIGLAIFLVGCMGFGRAFDLGWIPLLMAPVGMVATILGGMVRRAGVQHTAVLASVLLNVFALVGGIMEYAFSNGATIFPVP